MVADQAKNMAKRRDDSQKLDRHFINDMCPLFIRGLRGSQGETLLGGGATMWHITKDMWDIIIISGKLNKIKNHTLDHESFIHFLGCCAQELNTCTQTQEAFHDSTETKKIRYP